MASIAEQVNAARLAKHARALKILTLDIETKPMLVYSWGLFKQFHHIEHIVDHGGILCVGAKWLGEPTRVITNRDGDEPMLRQVWELLTEADIVVTYNGTRFDLPRLNNEFLVRGWGPPAPFKSVDLFKVNKQRFDLPSRKLDYLAQRSGTGAKVKHQGFDLWVDCINGDDKAWTTMVRYCKGDVELTEKLYLRLLPWLDGQAHIGLMAGGERLCPYCGSSNLSRQIKPVRAFVQEYTLYRCDDCTGWVRDTFKTKSPVRTRPVR